jgi:hypothetical protein
MFKSYRDKVAFSGFAVLSVGVALLIFTFASAYMFLNGKLQLASSQDLTQTFGEALTPLIAASIHIMYLGVMGWVGSLITVRGVTLVVNAPKTSEAEAGAAQKTQSQQKGKQGSLDQAAGEEAKQASKTQQDKPSS